MTLESEPGRVVGPRDHLSWAAAVGVIVLYCAPAVIGNVGPAWVNWERRKEIAKIASADLDAPCAERGAASGATATEPGDKPIAQQLAAYRAKRCACERRCDEAEKDPRRPLPEECKWTKAERAIQDPGGEPVADKEERCLPRASRDNGQSLGEFLRWALRRQWRLETALCVILSTLPALLVALPLRRVAPAEARRAAKGDLLSKLILFSCVAWSWVYFYNPMGQGATAYEYLLGAIDVSNADTLPLWMNLARSPSKHMTLAFLGFYVHMLALCWQKAVKGDVVSTRIYGLLFRKWLIVSGAAMALGAVARDEGAVLAFLIGLSPFGAVSVLREVSARRLDPLVEQDAALSSLPAISRPQIDRLEEEGIDSVPALAGASADELSRVIPSSIIRPELLAHWQDVARLVSILGAARYSKVTDVCLTAGQFVQRCRDKDVAGLQKAGVGDPQGVCASLIRIYPDLGAPVTDPQETLLRISKDLDLPNPPPG